ncbi:taste receptor type 2 member 16-like [Lissotriton helveticus]
MASVIAIIASVFILAFYLLEKAKGKRLNTCDIILVALGISFICFQCTLLGHCYAYEMKAVVPGILLQVTVWSGSCSSWLIACLSVFYCVKIVDFNNHLFFWLKQRISKLVPWLILGTVIGSLVLSIPLNFVSDKEYPQNSTANLKANATLQSEIMTWKTLFSYSAGDSAYAVWDFILTPYLNPANVREMRFNHAHKSKQYVIKQTFGILKSWFCCLHKSGGALQYSPETCWKIAATWAILHNIATIKGIPVKLTDTDTSEDEGPGPPCRPAVGVGAAARRQRRDNITQNYF